MSLKVGMISPLKIDEIRRVKNEMHIKEITDMLHEKNTKKMTKVAEMKHRREQQERQSVSEYRRFQDNVLLSFVCMENRKNS